MMTVDVALTKIQEAERGGRLSATAAAGMKRWLEEAPFARYREKLLHDVEAENWKQLDNAFFTVLEFGTGGRRGVMYPIGTNVLNDRTIAESARGLADYIQAKKGPGAACSCVIARDTRHNSPEFAELCARVMAAAGVKVHLFKDARSTPLLSFAVRHLGCDAGIMITASHNPPADNGFKCYAATGGQVIPPDDAGIIACVEQASDRDIPEKSLEDGLADGSIAYAGPEVDEAYIQAVVGESVSHARGVSIVYTPLHGVGESSVAAALKADGFMDVNILASQRTQDGDFPNVPNHVSNPENPSALAAAIAEARATGADLVLASDPDADRVGVGLPKTADPKGEWTTLDGNQIGVLIAAFVMKQYADRGRLRPDHYLVTTLVSTQMAKALARREGVRIEDDLLVGFKWIAERIDAAGPVGFLFGFEESHGYVKGTYVRDKDAAVASLLFAELAATCKDRSQSVLEYLDDLYVDVGHYGERLINKTYTGREGLDKIRSLMKAFREAPPKTVAGLPVTEVYDYKTHEIRDLVGSGEARPLPQPSGDLLLFHTGREGVRFAARPSGTEPKIKFYLFARTAVDGPDSLPAAKADTEAVLDQMTRDIEKYLEDVK
ncbi:phospho-sugar mutase [Planctomyces sp. SH-PL62]|uniref:phospho-sugar mutase n=1 Tax=Planctomyces sp. SH-PL62 TaxID=1636152 RepID=UPI00078D4F8B|nr:phospho-sugar mutase [Planctomyces sp. SH-PL62]AMV38953.1 Phosphoglucomutase [Planctomyces sp. SH-PL62]